MTPSHARYHLRYTPIVDWISVRVDSKDAISHVIVKLRHHTILIYCTMRKWICKEKVEKKMKKMDKKGLTFQSALCYHDRCTIIAR